MGLADCIEDTFPELKEIKSEDLRNKVVEVYCKAMMEGGWDSFEGIPFTKVIKTEITYVEHVRIVTNLAIRSAKTLAEFGKIKVNMDFLVAGGLLHDVGKLFEYSDLQRHEKLVRHPFSGAGLAMACGMPAEIVHIIAMHAKEGDLGKRIPEAVMVHHCDFIHFETVKSLTGQ